MINPIPEWLYRYRPLQNLKREIDMIREEKIWLSSPSAFDDPWDCSINPFQQQLGEEWNRYLEHLRIACFTTREDNTRMWSHYADNHSGICIGYYTPDDNKLFNKTDFEKVVYTNTIPTFDKLSVGCPETYEAIRTLLSTKSTDWEDQKEWRYIGGVGSDNLLRSSSQATATITFGIRCPERVKQYIKNELGGPMPVSFREVYQDPTSITPSIRTCEKQEPQVRSVLPLPV